MKIIVSYLTLLMALALLGGCKKYGDGNYPGAEVYAVVSIYDLKSLYKDQPLSITKKVLSGASQISGVVISDYTDKNLPEGLLILQDARRFNLNRGIAVNIGAAAADYAAGDSVTITITGGTMQRADGILQLTGLNNSAVTKLASGRPMRTTIIGDVSTIAQNPDVYESTLVTITKAEIDNPAPGGTTFAGDVTINDGSGGFPVHTEPNAAFASKELPFLATYIGVLLPADKGFKLWPRKADDIVVLSQTPPVIVPIIITGFLNNADGSDADYEYIQMMATRDIDFSATNYSVVACNNAGSGGAPVNSWAQGDVRTYKFDLTSGTVKKGSYFYVGGNKLINGAGSTDISSSNWIVSRSYSTLAGDGFGKKTSNLIANSGNPAGIAVFNTTDVVDTTQPIDVVFFGMTSTSNVFSSNPLAGYRITNTDYYETQNTTVPTLDAQPFFLMGTNVFKFTIVNDEMFRMLGGVYNIRSGKWTTKRTLTPVALLPTSSIAEIETGATQISEER